MLVREGASRLRTTLRRQLIVFGAVGFALLIFIGLA
jgi:hypothetical protein